MNLAAYHALDDETLATLTSKGLLRRARKDLERASPQLASRSAEAVVLTFSEEGVVVTLPPTGPQQATCTCPAEGICRHILAAVLFLPSLAEAQPEEAPARDEAAAPPAEPPAPAPPTSPLDVTEAELVAWAGRALYRQAINDIAGGLEAAIAELEQTIVVDFAQLNITTRWLAGVGLPGMICSCKRPAPCRHRVAAVLLYQAHHGKPLPALEAPLLAAAAGAPRSRAEVLASVDATLTDLVHPGLTRLSRTTRDRLQTLAISAHGVDLPRLERMLRSLADQAEWYLTRDVRASTATLLATAAHTCALAHALHHAPAPPPADLVGEHRARYVSAGQLDLVGLGAQQWHTRSGYVGLSLYFWDTSTRRWDTWSESRPTFYEQVSFDAHQRYQQAGPWLESPPLRQLCRSRVRLGNARRNRAGRLSGAAETQLLVVGTSAPADLDLAPVRFDAWPTLAQHLAAVSPAGLREHNPLDRLVVVTPARWGDPRYDQARQAVERPLLDTAGRVLLLVQPHNAAFPFAVETVQQWEPQQRGTWGILGHARITSSGLELLPVAFFNQEPLHPADKACILNVTLDPLLADTDSVKARETSPLPAPPSGPILSGVADDEEAADSDELAKPAESSAVGRLLATTLTLLEHLAEQGTASTRATMGDQLVEYSEQLRQTGLTTCADSLTTLAACLAASRHQATPDWRHPARTLLRTAYVVCLATDQLVFARGIAPGGQETTTARSNDSAQAGVS